MNSRSDEKRIAILDCDLIARKKHRFPNLACEKISSYYKSQEFLVDLITKYPEEIEWQKWKDKYNFIFVSKVFTDTEIPSYIQTDRHIYLGGTGFYFDHADPLPEEIEHSMPDYDLYAEWIKGQTANGISPAEFKAYEDYSIGFLTRGCFRKCRFCVNQKYDRVSLHSPLKEFLDPTRKKICLLDDNVFGYAEWKNLFQDLIDTGKPFQFKQGLDERLLTEEKCNVLFNSKYDGDIIFAFDNIEDYDLIHEKLKLIQQHNTKNKRIKFYVLVGFKSIGIEDIEDAFKRIELLFNYHCIPYVMRYISMFGAHYTSSKYFYTYNELARWCNQPAFVKKCSFKEFCIMDQARRKHAECKAYKQLLEIEKECPHMKRYFDMKFGGDK